MELASQSTDNKIQQIEDISIAIMIKNFNPTLLNYELLTMNGTIPNNWELAENPISNVRGSRILFKNGVEIVAQGNTINFRQPLKTPELEKLELPEVVVKYIANLPNAEYQGFSIAPKIIIPFVEQDGGKNFIHSTFFNNGSWRNFQNSSVQASLTLSYQLEDYNLGVNINPAKLQQPNQPAISAILFAGNFNYNLIKEGSQIPRNILENKLKDWQKNIETFRSLVYQKFLQQAPKQPEKQSLFDT